MCAGVGIDIVSVARIERLVRERGGTFLPRWFTPAEIDYCAGKARPSRHLAARFAAKEAVVKALPADPEGPLAWRCIEILPVVGGGPRVRLTGAVREAAVRAGVGEIRVSLSHCDEYATAVATVDVTR
jgi:holo-[acyl-carrier protein] synthase